MIGCSLTDKDCKDGKKQSHPFKVQAGQTAEILIPKIPNALPRQVPSQQNLCSVPLLQVQPHPSENFTIRRAPAPPIDPAMVAKTLVPSCDEKASVEKPANTMPPTLDRRQR